MNEEKLSEITSGAEILLKKTRLAAKIAVFAKLAYGIFAKNQCAVMDNGSSYYTRIQSEPDNPTKWFCGKYDSMYYPQLRSMLPMEMGKFIEEDRHHAYIMCLIKELALLPAQYELQHFYRNILIGEDSGSLTTDERMDLLYYEIAPRLNRLTTLALEAAKPYNKATLGRQKGRSQRSARLMELVNNDHGKWIDCVETAFEYLNDNEQRRIMQGVRSRVQDQRQDSRPPTPTPSPVMSPGSDGLTHLCHDMFGTPGTPAASPVTPLPLHMGWDLASTDDLGNFATLCWEGPTELSLSSVGMGEGGHTIQPDDDAAAYTSPSEGTAGTPSEEGEEDTQMGLCIASMQLIIEQFNDLVEAETGHTGRFLRLSRTLRELLTERMANEQGSSTTINTHHLLLQGTVARVEGGALLLAAYTTTNDISGAMAECDVIQADLGRLRNMEARPPPATQPLFHALQFEGWSEQEGDDEESDWDAQPQQKKQRIE